MTSIVDDTTIVKNYKILPFIFSSSVIQMPKIQGKYSIFKERGEGGGAAPDGKLRKKIEFGLIHGGSGRLLLKETLLNI